MTQSTVERIVIGHQIGWPTRSDISPLRYPGGKRKLAPVIAGILSGLDRRPELFVETFAGGASVSISLLEADAVATIGLTDADPMVAAFWKIVFSDRASELADRILNAEVSLAEWRRLKFSAPDDVMERAYRCLYLNRTSFSGSIHPYAGPMGGKTQTSAHTLGSRFNQQKIARRIVELGDLRHRVAFVRNESYADTIAHVTRSRSPSETGGDLFWYLDPPFFAKAERLYEHHFKTDDHLALRQALDLVPGSWVLSYDDHPMSRELYAGHPGFRGLGIQYTAGVNAGRATGSEILVVHLEKHGVQMPLSEAA